MSDLLASIRSPDDLKKCSLRELRSIAADIRSLILETVSRNGGHLAPNLGTVELTLALLKVFDPPKDRIVWDVSHQSYAYKILTGRRDSFHTLRQYGGLSGFLSRKESPYDAFGAGHSGTALSAALGMAVARDRRQGRDHVVAILGDGALGCGISLEALNNISSTAQRMVVILNDNEMSISANVGAVSRYLGELLANPRYNRWKAGIESTISRMSGRSQLLRRIYWRVEEAIKSIFLHSVMFEEFGLRYIGPINGHDLPRLISAMEIARDYDRPILLHVATQKGRGYPYAEACPEAWHGTGAFDIATGQPSAAAAVQSYSQIMGAALEILAAKDPSIVAITAAMKSGTGLGAFADRYPDRFFDVGICEEHAAVFAAGLAAEGLLPVFAVYSTFAQRSVDCIIHDICLQQLPVVFCLDRAGIVGDDGPTHHGVFDIALLRSIPNLLILQPSSGVELVNMLHSAIRWKRPVAIRYPRGGEPGFVMPEVFDEIPCGKARIAREGWEVQIWALGDTMPIAFGVADALSQKGLSAGVVDARFVCPLDEELLASQSKRAIAFLSLENGVASGGFGSAVEEFLVANGYKGSIVRGGWPREFLPHGNADALMKRFGMTPEILAGRILKSLAG